ncbi:hypothetical protein HDU93_001764, partial [Gonapodya sp. JEL0774]
MPPRSPRTLPPSPLSHDPSASPSPPPPSTPHQLPHSSPTPPPASYSPISHTHRSNPDDDTLKPLSPSSSQLFANDPKDFLSHQQHNSLSSLNLDPNSEISPDEDPRLKRIIYVALALLVLVLVALAVGLAILITHRNQDAAAAASSSSGSGNVAGSAPSSSASLASPTSTSSSSTKQSVASPTVTYDYSGWTGGCQGCGQYGGYTSGSTSKSTVNVFGTTANMTDPIDCNAWSVYYNLTITLDYTNS